MIMTGKTYDKAYFDKWYRNSRSRVVTRDDVRRKAALAVAAAEYLLERPVRSVLDIGAGEGSWNPALRKLRPRIRYTGVDPSEYAVRRYGRSRNLVLGRFHELDELGLDGAYDLVICCGVMNYLTPRELSAGLQSISAMLGGVAFLEIWAAEDEIVGDTHGWHDRPARWWSARLRDAGLRRIGLHLYAGPSVTEHVAAME
jgi:SAM-dependent methyltransferase